MRFVLAAAAAILAITAFWQFEPRVGRLWLSTAYLAAGACLIALPLGTLAALAIVKTNAPGRGLATMLLAALLGVPLFLIAKAWDAGFGIQGWQTLLTNPHIVHLPWLAGWRAAIWVHGLAAVPWVALIVAAGLRAVEAETEEEASLSGSPARVLWHITLPRAAPAITVAALWMAIVTSVEISVTDFFQVRTFAEEVYTQAQLGTFDFSAGSQQPTAPSATGLWIGLLLSILLAFAALFAARRWLVDFASVPLRPKWTWRMGSGRWLAGGMLWFIMLLVVGVPFGNLVYKVGGQATQTEAGLVHGWSIGQALYRVQAAPREFAGDLWLSAKIGAAAASAALLVGVPLAWSLRLSRRPAFLRLIGLALCLTIPGPLLGIGMIRFLNRPPESPLAFLAVLYDSNFAPWLVQTIRAVPLVTLIAWAALASIPQATLDAAAMDGAGRWGCLLRIALPQRWSALFAAWLVGLAIAVGELAATVLVVPPGRSTAITVRLFQLLHYGVDDRVAAISLVLAAAISALTAAAAAFVRFGFRHPTR
ncbi:MAG: ABC transporter permease subunit [Pirellulales bacterium]